MSGESRDSSNITNIHPYKFFILRGTKDLIDNVVGIKSYYQGAADDVVNNSITDSMDSDYARSVEYTQNNKRGEWSTSNWSYNVYTRWCHILKVVQL